MSALVTFVVPTVGRTSLADTIVSLKAQSDPDWQAIVVIDGPHLIRTAGHADDRISYVHAPHRRSAGLTRNFALPLVTTEWTAFVDDDDELAPEYVERLRALAPGNDVVVFRMEHPSLGVLPTWEDPSIEWGQVGISYAVRSEFFSDVGVCFARERPSASPGPWNEDIQLLRLLDRLDAQLAIADYVGYFVRPRTRAA